MTEFKPNTVDVNKGEPSGGQSIPPVDHGLREMSISLGGVTPNPHAPIAPPSGLTQEEMSKIVDAADFGETPKV